VVALPAYVVSVQPPGSATRDDSVSLAFMLLSPRLAWRSDSRHILAGNLVMDLAGRVVATRPVPAGTQLIAARPDRQSLLVYISEGMDPNYGVTDERGRIVYKSPPLRRDCPGCDLLTQFGWGARPDEVLWGEMDHATLDWWIYAADRRGGTRMVHRIGPNVDGYIIAPVTDPSAAPHSTTF
jgi:hypothetical protein